MLTLYLSNVKCGILHLFWWFLKREEHRILVSSQTNGNFTVLFTAAVRTHFLAFLCQLTVPVVLVICPTLDELSLSKKQLTISSKLHSLANLYIYVFFFLSRRLQLKVTCQAVSRNSVSLQSFKINQTGAWYVI